MHKTNRIGISPAIEQPAQPPPPSPASIKSKTEIQKINLHHQPAETEHRNNGRDSTATARKIPANFKHCLKTVMEDACLVSAGRLFHSFAPRYEKHFCPLQMFSLVTLNLLPYFEGFIYVKMEATEKGLMKYFNFTIARKSGNILFTY